MINVLVVEDEPPILRGICTKIRKTHSDFNIIHTAYNGQEAINYLASHTVDVIFTDINMPMMTGLELLEYVNISYPHIITIILSGYQEFNYAKKAIKFNAYDYLLKPLESDALHTLLHQISIELSTKKYINVQRYLFDTIHGEHINTHSNLCHIQPGFYLLILCAGSFPTKGLEYLSPAREYWDNINLELLVKQFLPSKTTFWIISGKTSSEKLIILNNILPPQLSSFIELLYQILQNSLLPITLITSEEISNLSDMNLNYEVLRNKLYYHILFSYSQIINLCSEPFIKEYMISSYDEKKLLYSLEQNHFSSFKQELLILSKRLSALKISQFNLEAILKQIVTICKKTNFTLCTMNELESEFQEALSNCYTYEALFNNLIEIIFNYHLEKNEIASNDKVYLIEQIEAFLKDNLTESITSQVLSCHFGLVATYISKLFKIHKGVSPSEYILMLRIEKAKEMLINDSSLLVKDIAQIVGYSDALYFSRVFKKSTGIYPSEYRKKIT